MRQRPAARLLVLDPEGRLLLFKFVNLPGSGAGRAFWATPGGALDPGETYAEAARRELFEETGFEVADIGQQAAQRTVAFTTAEGVEVSADERYFLVRVGAMALSRDNWTALERATMKDHRWWTPAELRAPAEQVWPEDIAAMLESVQGPDS